MNVLVTGGAGFIGSHVVDMLVNNGHDVTVLDIVSKRKALQGNLQLSAPDIKYMQGDITNEGDVMLAMENANAVAHLAALTSVPESQQEPGKYSYINIEGTINVAKIAERFGVEKVVFASSAAVYGDATEQEEGLEGKARSFYGTTKFAGEDIIENVRGISLRMFNVYGPRQDAKAPYAGVIPKFISALQDNKQVAIYGDGKNTRDFVHIKDVVQAFGLALNSDLTGRYNIGTGRAVSVNELLDMLCKKMGKKTKPVRKDAIYGEIRHSCAIIDKAKEQLGYKPTLNLETGLNSALDWYCHH